VQRDTSGALCLKGTRAPAVELLSITGSLLWEKLCGNPGGRGVINMTRRSGTELLRPCDSSVRFSGAGCCISQTGALAWRVC